MCDKRMVTKKKGSGDERKRSEGAQETVAVARSSSMAHDDGGGARRGGSGTKANDDFPVRRSEENVGEDSVCCVAKGKEHRSKGAQQANKVFLRFS
jgi:hypothetical protein